VARRGIRPVERGAQPLRAGMTRGLADESRIEEAEGQCLGNRALQRVGRLDGGEIQKRPQR
jgi:hypothetical protein